MIRTVALLTFCILSVANASAANAADHSISTQHFWNSDVISGIVAALITAFGMQLISWFTRPILSVDFERKDNGIVRWEAEYEEGGKKVSFDRLLAVLRVSNIGFRVAIDCRVYLVGIERVEQGRTIPTRYSNSLQLSWPGWKFDPRRVYRNVPVYIEAISVDRNDPKWVFQAQGLREPQRDLDGYKGIYRLKVVAVADNAAPCFVIADVSFSGTLESLQIRKVSPLTKTTWELILG